MAMGVIGGSIDVAVVAFANAQHWPAASSFILAAYALGSLVSGLVFGGFIITLPLERQYLIGVLITAFTAILPMLSMDVYTMTGMIFVASLSFAPTMIVVMNLGTIIIPPSKLTEGLTWMTTGISFGVALGGAISGRVIDAFGAQAGFGVPIAAGLFMVIVVLIGLRTLHRASGRCEVPKCR
ncbi:MFS transporter [Serratia sp. CY37345]|uniref:MFS transporter n=1 Tax=Serratia sp. CY37345 TaxID=3383610 RepID=UPI003FA02FDF